MSKHISFNKDTQFDEWYQHIIQEGDMIRYHDVSGCYVMLPNSYYIWEQIQAFLDSNFKARGIKNCYFPMFISQQSLKQEKEHLEGFKPEVAWVTGHGDIDYKGKGTKDNNGKKLYHEMDQAIALRPTSESVMYQHYKSLVSSYLDLPLRLNQWNNVVRWEFKEPTPFIRCREFLWQEGHSSFGSRKEAMTEVEDILILYQETFEKVLSVPTIRGRKTESEKFPGCDFSLSLETFIPESGKGIQACTAHHLGQHFSKMYDITYFDRDGIKDYVWQNSWGYTVRSIGIMIMLHGDNKGLVLPPQVTQLQVIIVPIFKKKTEEMVMEYAKDVAVMLNSSHVIIDDRKKKPGWKFNYWETRGIPIRLEIGEKDVKEKKVSVYRRDKDEKHDVQTDKLKETLDYLLSIEIPAEMYLKAHKKLISSIQYVTTLESAKKAIDNNKMFCCNVGNDIALEQKIKEVTGAKPLCIPDENEFRKFQGGKCFLTGDEESELILFGRSY